MRFIHFIELIPQFRDILLRDRPAAVEYGNMCVLPLSSDPHLDPLLIFCMVDGVRQIISDHLFCLKFIRPHIQFLIRHKINRCARLLSQDLTACDHAAHQAYDVKPLELHLIRTEFQLIEGQEILHHMVHLVCFIHDHIAVELAALRILIDPFLQSFRIPLDQGNRRFQLVGYISEEFIAHLFDLFFLLDIHLQFVIRALQFRDRLLQLL